MTDNVVYLTPPAKNASDEPADCMEAARCLALLLAAPVDAWKGCDRATVGGVFDMLHEGTINIDQGRRWLGGAGLGVKVFARARDAAGAPSLQPKSWLRWGEGHPAYLLAVPRSGPALARIYHGTPWETGGWWRLLKTLPIAVGKERIVWRIAGKAHRCILLDVERFAPPPPGISETMGPAVPKAEFRPVGPRDPAA